MKKEDLKEGTYFIYYWNEQDFNIEQIIKLDATIDTNNVLTYNNNSFVVKVLYASNPINAIDFYTDEYIYLKDNKYIKISEKEAKKLILKYKL